MDIQKPFKVEAHGDLVFRLGSRFRAMIPCSIPTGFDITFGEMDLDKKHGMSHRHHAFVQLVDACFKDELGVTKQWLPFMFIGRFVPRNALTAISPSPFANRLMKRQL